APAGPDSGSARPRVDRRGDRLRRLLALATKGLNVSMRRLGNYELVREIGRGAMGIVYEAKQHGLDRTVAVKLLHPSYADDPRRVARFRHEAELVAGLHHPAIVPVYEFGDVDGTLFYSMELIDGAPLDRLVRFFHDHPKETTAGRAITTVL